MSIFSTIGSALSSAFSGATVYIMIAVAAISAGGSSYLTYKVEHAKVAVLQVQNQQCLDANLSSAATVTATKRAFNGSGNMPETVINSKRCNNSMSFFTRHERSNK